MQLDDIFTGLDRAAVAEAAHRAMRTINYRDGADHMIAGLAYEAPESRAAAAALAALRRIEDAEQSPIAELSEAQASKYVGELSDFVMQRFKQELHYDDAVGRKLAAELLKAS